MQMMQQMQQLQQKQGAGEAAGPPPAPE